MRRSAFVALALAATFAGCGLDLVGVDAGVAGDAEAPMQDDGAVLADAADGAVLADAADGAVLADAADGAVLADAADGALPDAANDGAAEDAAADAHAPCACTLLAPAGFTLVAYAGDRAASCSGDLSTEDLLASPVAGSGACTCGACTITAMPSCTATSFNTSQDLKPTATCDLSGASHTTSAGCIKDNGTIGDHGRVNAPSPQGAGACTASPIANEAAVTTTSVRVCRATGATCACDPGLAPSFKTCLSAPGDVACPAIAPNKHQVATTADLQCAACPCTLSQKACNASVTWYSDNACSNKIATIDSTTCGSQNGGGSYSSLTYTVTPTAQCSVGASPATVSLPSADTICCP